MRICLVGLHCSIEEEAVVVENGTLCEVDEGQRIRFGRCRSGELRLGTC